MMMQNFDECMEKRLCVICGNPMTTMLPCGKSFIRSCAKHGTYAKQFAYCHATLNNVIDRVRHSRDTLGEFFDAGTFRRRPGMKYTLERLYNELDDISKPACAGHAEKTK